MSSPSSDQVAANLNAGIENPGTPFLNAFGGAWAALQDFTGQWGADFVLDVQGYGDYISQFNGTSSR